MLLQKIIAAYDRDCRKTWCKIIDHGSDKVHEALQSHSLSDASGLAFE